MSQIDRFGVQQRSWDNFKLLLIHLTKQIKFRGDAKEKGLTADVQ
jgi:hypothetical protein